MRKLTADVGGWEGHFANCNSPEMKRAREENAKEWNNELLIPDIRTSLFEAGLISGTVPIPDPMIVSFIKHLNKYGYTIEANKRLTAKQLEDFDKMRLNRKL